LASNLKPVKFIGRRHYLSVLEGAWRSQDSAFIPIYGRRRVGKSEMIVHFMEDKNGIYFLGKRASARAQIQEFLTTAARALNEPLLAKTQVGSWKAALELVDSRWTKPGKLILALDEFQWTVEASAELPSVMQEFWDRRWAKSGRIVLILCGSYLGFMEREVLGKRSPLFGRRTAQILLRPFSHIEAAAFHPGLSTDDHARIYAICGGIPAYLLAFDQSRSVEQNIADKVLEESSALAQEPEFLLREELRDLVPYHAVLMALANGKASPAELSKATGIDARALPYHLNTLVGLGYVQRRYPLVGGRPSLRSVRYALDDPFLRFWFRFVFPQQSLLRVLGPRRGFTEAVRPQLDAYFGHCFERLCREALPLLYVREGVRSAFEVGEYWDHHIQIDVVGLRQDNRTDLCECKWGSVASLATVAKELELKVRHFPNKRRATLGRRLFVRAKPGDKAHLPAGFQLHTLDELYSLSVEFDA
jgi:uncharacterized protein